MYPAERCGLTQHDRHTRRAVPTGAERKTRDQRHRRPSHHPSRAPRCRFGRSGARTARISPSSPSRGKRPRRRGVTVRTVVKRLAPWSPYTAGVYTSPDLLDSLRQNRRRGNPAHCASQSHLRSLGVRPTPVLWAAFSSMSATGQNRPDIPARANARKGSAGDVQTDPPPSRRVSP